MLLLLFVGGLVGWKEKKEVVVDEEDKDVCVRMDVS